MVHWFRTETTYDKLNRPTAVLDNNNQSSELRYDSRGNVVFASDPALSGLGNSTTYEYDSANRQTAVVRHLWLNGQPGGTYDHAIRTDYTYYKDGTLKTIQDGNANVTTHTYDPLLRLQSTLYADGESETWTYKKDDQVATFEDQRGVVLTHFYDAGGRLQTRTAAGIATLGPETYTYDAMDRLTSGTYGSSTVERSYDSFGGIIQEKQNGRIVLSIYDGVGNLRGQQYAGEIFQRVYDVGNRLDTIADLSGTIVDFGYVGPRRVESQEFVRNDITATYEYDGLRRVEALSYDDDFTATPLDHREYEWDAASNKKARVRVDVPQQIRYDYEYDSVYELVESVRTIGVAVDQTVDYTLDDVANRDLVVGGPDAGNYSPPDIMLAVFDETNRYLTTPAGTREYDDAGNLTKIIEGGKTVTITYDHLNRMVSYEDGVAGPLFTYAYDAFGRRISKTIDSGVAPPETTEYLYFGYQCVADIDGATGLPIETYVYGLGLRDILLARSSTSDTYYLSDDMGNVVALAGDTPGGGLLEEFDYGDFGRPLDAGTLMDVGATAAEFLFQGQRWDAETGLYHYGFRYLDPTVGRFTTRDPLGDWGDPSNLGNGYALAGNNPWTQLDPVGLRCGYGALIDARTRLLRGMVPSTEQGPQKAAPPVPPLIVPMPSGRPSVGGGGGQRTCGSSTWTPPSATPQGVKGAPMPYRGIGPVYAGADPPWAIQPFMANATNGSSGADTRKKAYLVSRPLDFPGLDTTSHNFIVVGARFIGDDQATVISFGELKNGKMGRLDGLPESEISRFSRNTAQSDYDFWVAQDRDDSTNVTLIDAPSSTVERWADRVLSTRDYSITSTRIDFYLYRGTIYDSWTNFWTGGSDVNSNSAASAVANWSEGKPVRIPDGQRSSPGSDNWRLVPFRGPETRRGSHYAPSNWTASELTRLRPVQRR